MCTLICACGVEQAAMFTSTKTMELVVIIAKTKALEQGVMVTCKHKDYGAAASNQYKSCGAGGCNYHCCYRVASRFQYHYLKLKRDTKSHL